MYDHKTQSQVAFTNQPNRAPLGQLTITSSSMRQSPGSYGDRNNNQQHQQHQQHHQQHQKQQYGGSSLPSPYSQAQSFYQRPQAPRATTSSTSHVQRDIVAFIETFRAHQSSLTVPPNALTLDSVVRAICSHFRVNTFEDLMGTSALQLPVLKQLHTVNQRVWTFVTCFIQSRRIHTLFECQQSFLQHEGLRSFHELKLGNSFLHTEAVQHLYHAPVAVMNITTRDVLGCLRQFEEMLLHDAFRASSHIDRNEFAQFLAQQYRQPSVQAMGVVIDPSGFGVYVGMLRRIANHEMKEIKTLEQQFQREIAEKMFRLTKEKFSDDNRKQALDELLQQTNARLSQQENDEVSQRRRKNSSVQSLSLDMLKRVTDVDVYLDNVLRRKAVADGKSQRKLVKPISSQEIAETDSKLRNQLTRFLVSSQKSRHHSRLKVVTWVICSIMAKTYALLLSDDKLPDDDGLDEKEMEAVKPLAESDKEECDCCCVGKDSCTCSCTCKCHVESSDEEDANSDHQEKATEVDEKVPASGQGDSFPVMPTDPFASRLGKMTPEVNVTLEEVANEVESFLSSNQQIRDNQPQTTKDVLLVLSSLETHLIRKFSVKRSAVSWAGRRSVLELLPHLLSDTEDENNEAETNVGTWLLSLVRSSEGGHNDGFLSKTMSEKCLLEEVISFVRECRAAISSSSALSSLSSEKQQQWIANRVSVQLGCTRTEERGLPSVNELAKLVDQKPDGEEISMIKYVGSLDLNHGNGTFDNAVTREGATGESLQKFLTEQALEKLRKCPYLIDVSLYMDWQERYASICGSLLSFIRVHEMILLDHAPLNNFMFICCLNGTILRVNEKSTPSDLELLLARAQQEQTFVAASQVAVHLVSMMVTSKSQANYPKQLVQAHLRAYLSIFAKDRTVASSRPRFVLEVLLETPVEFADFTMSLLIGLVAQDPGLGVSNDWGAADQVWKACQSDAERKMLVFISSRSLSPLWASQTEKWCTVRENLTAAIVDCDAENSNDTSRGVTETKAAPPSDAGKNNEHDDTMISNLLDAPDSEVVFASLSNELLDQDIVDGPSTESLNRADTCHSFIEDLRKKQFGVGLQIHDEATTSVLLTQQQRLERALKRLSDELYSESTHFVLELLQNADDNAYDDAVVPLGDFSLTADKNIVFYNNERGFSLENIRAICDVGASTKEATNLEASISKKGIGFKSVFKVSDDPQVHSNGFHICFHARNSRHRNGMGYILPYWLDDTTQWKQRRGTTFVLPLNEASMHRVDDISQSLLAFEPSVLLFLRRIRELRLRDLARQHTLHFLKKEKKLQANTHVVQLLSQVEKSENSVDVVQQNWLVVKKRLEPSPLFSRSHPTEIALAFPVADQQKGFSKQTDRPPLQQVFAYLPLRSYGFRFILQGDFEIPSSREAIINGSEWNEWLISKFPTLIRAAVSSYISTVAKGETSNGRSSGENVAAAISHLISLLPLENEVQAPFRSIIPDIMRELRQVKWLAGASFMPSSSSGGKLHMPSDLIDCVGLTGIEVSGNMPALLEALTEDVLISTFHKRFLHPALSRDMSAMMKTQLRIEQLHSSHLMRVLSLSAERNDIDWTAKILALLAKLWRKDRHSKLLRQELRLIKCFPLQQKRNTDGKTRWISLAEGHDSLFLSGVQAGNTNFRHKKSYDFYGDLCILDDRFTKAFYESSRLRTFLMDDVGIHVMEDHELIRHHILPKMAMLRPPTDNLSDESIEKLDVKVLIEYGQFLSLHLISCSNCPMQADVKANMVVAATSGRVLTVGMSDLFVVLPSMFKEMPQLVSWITTKAETCKRGENAFGIVSGEYFSDNDSPTDILLKKSVDQQWQELLVHVCDLPLLFDTASLTSDPRSQARMQQILKWIEAEDDIAVKRSISKHLAEHLDKHWRATDSHFNSKSSDSTIHTNDQGDIFHWWHQNYWLEGSDGEFHRSIDLFISTETTTRLFTPAMVTFAAMTWENKDLSERVLGMKADATVSDVLSVISSLSVDSALVSTLDIDQMVRMYTFLWEKSQHSDACRDKIARAFSCKMMLFVPAEADASGEDNRNHFTGITNVVWSSTVHNSELFALETQYPKALSAFFTEVCGVQRKPSVSFLCERITRQADVLTNHVQSKRSGSEKTELWEQSMFPLLCALSKKVKKCSLSKKETKTIKKTLKSASWLPVRCVNRPRNGLVFCRLKDQPVLATTENEKKLQKLMLSITKKGFVDLDVKLNQGKQITDNEDIQMVQLDTFVDDGGLDALLSFATISTISAHLGAHANSWCKTFARLTKSSQLDNRKGTKKLLKLGQLLVKAWASVFSSPTSSVGDQEIRQSVQHLDLFPTIDDNGRWTSAANLYINDQADLSKQDLQQPGLAGQLEVLGLFSWNYFADDSASEDTSSEVTRVHKFLTECCGMKSLKEHMQYEVSVLSTQHLASEAFHEKIRTAFALAQRFLFHSHRRLYDQLHHDSIAKLASELQCLLVDGHDGFQVVYRVGNLLSLRRGMDALSRCFLDVPKNTLYMQCLTGEEEASALSVVLMELSRKLFGTQVASSVANLLYLSLLQPNSLLREQWLVETQLLPPYPANEAGSLWVEHSVTPALIANDGSRKRAPKDFEDGEIAAEDDPAKKHCAPLQNDKTHDTSLAPFAPANYGMAGNGESYGMQMQRPPYPLLPSANGSADGAPYYPLLSSRAGMQSLSLSNTMSKDEREAIGRWGEEYVYNQLKQQHADNELNLTVEWLNEKEESGLPYDLTLSSGNKVVEYIEVKSTRTTEKGVFEISMNELDQAAMHGSTYCIYRVFNAGNPALCRVIRMKNPVSLVRQRKIQLALVMQ